LAVWHHSHVSLLLHATVLWKSDLFGRLSPVAFFPLMHATKTVNFDYIPGLVSGGGHGHVSPNNIIMITTGKAWISLAGPMEYENQLLLKESKYEIHMPRPSHGCWTALSLINVNHRRTRV
jgi:hypothetical protein